MATGDSFTTIAFSYRVGKSTVTNIVPEVCDGIWKVLSPVHLPPLDQIQWNAVADEYWLKWNFPNCLGAIDGKHVVVQVTNLRLLLLCVPMPVWISKK